MSKVKIQGNASGTGVFTIEAPGTNDPRTLTLPNSTGTLLDENSSLPAANLTGTVATARLGSGTADSTTFLRGDQTYAEAGGGAYEILDVVNVTSSTASVLVATGMSTAYRKYKVAFACTSPSAGVSLRMQGRKAGVVQTSNYTYASYSIETGGTTTTDNSAATTSVNLSGGWGLRGPNQQFHGEIDFADIYSDGYYRFHWSSTGRKDTPTTTELVIGAGAFDSGGTWDGFQFFYSSGNIQTGRFFLLGQKGA